MEADLIWLAGLIEGEGTFSTGTTPGVVVGMRDRDVIERVAVILGTHVRVATQRGKQLFVAGVWGDKARWLMGLLHPLMGQRRQARIIELAGKHWPDRRYG